MAVGPNSRSRARTITLLALLATAATTAVAAARDASARWRPATTGSDGAGRVRVTSSRVLGLYPGATKRLILTLHNGGPRRVVVGSVHVRNTATTKRGCAPSRRNLSIRQYRGPALMIPPHGIRRISVWLTMPNSVANACQRAIFKLRYGARLAGSGRSS
jgi:hypothetical protein